MNQRIIEPHCPVDTIRKRFNESVYLFTPKNFLKLSNYNKPNNFAYKINNFDQFTQDLVKFN